MRKLKNGTEAEEFEFPISLKVYTKCPSKYMLVDLETGEEYIGQKHQKKHWKRIKHA
jgi:hypothetical protein